MKTPARQDILRHLTLADPSSLFEQADAVRRKHCGDAVYLRAIIEFSNCCARDCLYCGLRRSNTKAQRYRMTAEEIVGAARTVMASGVRTIVLQSGDDARYDTETLGGIIGRIKAIEPGTAITLSIGERPFEDYAALKEAGADRYLLKHETVNEALYANLHPGQSLHHRLSILRELRRLGYQVGCGFIVGLPGQTVDDLVDEILFLADFQPDMAGIGPFVPQADTPLGRHKPGSVEMTLRMLALARIATRNTLLPATTALATLDPQAGYEAGLRAGANVIMIDCTPDPYRARYSIYDGRTRTTLDRVRRAIAATGRTMCLDRGDSLKLTPTSFG